MGKRHIQRLRRADGLRVPPTKRKLMRRGILHRAVPTKAAYRGPVWTWDFSSDATVRGGTLKMLTIRDEPTRGCHALRPERVLRAADVLAWLGTGHPETRCARVPAPRRRPGVYRQRSATLAG